MRALVDMWVVHLSAPLPSPPTGEGGGNFSTDMHTSRTRMRPNWIPIIESGICNAVPGDGNVHCAMSRMLSGDLVGTCLGKPKVIEVTCPYY